MFGRKRRRPGEDLHGGERPGGIPPELLRRVRAIEIKARRLVNDLFLGEYAAVFRGRGLEFDELRPYLPGDDPRSIDWKAFARTGDPLIRRYREDRDLTVIFAVDVSASQVAGAQPGTKADLAAELCAVLALAPSLASAQQKQLPVTTTSTEALALYQKALDYVENVEYVDARPLLDEAIQKDPGFAMAYALRAVVAGGFNVARENRDKALHVHFIKREELDPGLPGWLADRLIAAADGDGRYSLDGLALARDLRGDGERLRALIGHLTRAGVISPSPSAPDRVAGRVTGRFDGRAAALCRTSIEDAASARWRQYREVWAYVEEDACRRAAILRHFGDPAAGAPRAATASPADSAAPRPGCCDVCDPALALAAPKPDPVAIGSLDEAIIAVARIARPAVGRTTCAEILHGSRSKKIQRNSYDGLPAYGVSSHMRRADILARVDQLIDDGRLETTGGPYPVLRVAA